MTQGQAKRLVYEAGQWTLEIEQLKAHGGHVFRPRHVPVQGTKLISEWLKNNQPGLLQAAAHIFAKSYDDAENLAFQADNKTWLSTAYSPAAKVPDEHNAGLDKEAAHDLAEIRQHLFLLESKLGTLHKLESRVARLERMLQSGAASQAAAAAPEAHSVSDPSTADKNAESPVQQDSVQPDPVQQDSAQQTQEPAVENEVTLVNVERPEQDLGAVDAAAAAPERDDRLSVPTPTAMQETIAALLGAAVELSEDLSSPPPALAELSGPCYICQIIDDQGEIEGLILTDLEATVRLGGSLMMTPVDEIANQIANAEPSEDVVDAAAEIFNNLSGVLNAVEGNKHIKVDTARPLLKSEHSWLAEPYLRHDFKFAEGGRLAYLLK